MKEDTQSSLVFLISGIYNMRMFRRGSFVTDRFTHHNASFHFSPVSLHPSKSRRRRLQRGLCVGERGGVWDGGLQGGRGGVGGRREVEGACLWRWVRVSVEG